MTDSDEIRDNIVVNLNRVIAKYSVSSLEQRAEGNQRAADEEAMYADAVADVALAIQRGDYDSIKIEPWLDGKRAWQEARDSA